MSLLHPDTFRQIVDTLPMGISVVGLDRHVAFWNRAAEQITGYLKQEVMGRVCHQDILVPCGARGTAVCATAGCPLTCALRDGTQVEAMLFARHKNGHRIPVHVRSLPLWDAKGKVFAVAEIFQQLDDVADFHWTADSGADSPDGLRGPSITATETYLSSKLKACQPAAVFLIELKDKQAMAKQRGMEMVHALTRAMIHTVRDLLSMPHFLGRWHGDRFLIIVPNLSGPFFDDLLQQLEGIGGSCSVTWWGDRVAAQVHVTARYSKPERPSNPCCLVLSR